MPELHRISGEDYVKLVDEEMQTCYRPKITNPSSAPIDDVIRDIHKVLTGNGGPTHGLIFKVAATNVTARGIKDDIVVLNDAINKQADTCFKYRTAVEKSQITKNAKYEASKNFGKILWDNRSTLLLLFAIAIFFVYAQFAKVTTPAVKLTDKQLLEQISQMIDRKTAKP